MEKTKEFNREEQTKYEMHILIKEEIEKQIGIERQRLIP